jgi:altronate hydrolase
VLDRRQRSENSTGVLEAMDRRVLRMDPRDNLVIALVSIERGQRITVDGNAVDLISNVPEKHKFVTEDRAVGEEVRMYGITVGKATKPIAKGEIVSTLNVTHATSGFHEKSRTYSWTAPDVSRWRSRTFLGYHRSDGQVGTRNYWLVVPLVFCENRNILAMKEAFEEELGFAAPRPYRRFVSDLVAGYRAGSSAPSQGAEASTPGWPANRVFANVDGIKFLIHQAGCGGTREDADNLCGLLAGYINHPNVAGATVLSLGCQHSQVEILQEQVRKRNPRFSKPLHIFEQQKSASESAMLFDAIRTTFHELVEADRSTRREPAPLSKLRVGLKCGGSDGFSGITANPVVGRISDLIVSLGGATVLSEFPELCGVEQDLIDRCVNDNVANRFIQLMTDYAARAKAVRSAFDMNPSPGNIRDGLITDAMKSAGAARKGGSAPIAAVIDYPEYTQEQGLHLQCTPGNDVECVTAQVGAGANIVLFTTGLGTPTGNPVAPVVKIATNSELVRRMSDIIDFDTGPVLDGGTAIDDSADALLEQVVRIASGEMSTKAEALRQDDFIPWKRGVSL